MNYYSSDLSLHPDKTTVISGMKNLITNLLILFLVSATSAFAQKSNPEFTIMGVMQHSELEGGCWYLDSRSGKFELTGSPADLATCKVEGRQLTLKVRQAKMMSSPCMIGKMVQIVEVIDTAFHPHNPPVNNMKISGTMHRTKTGCWYVLTAKKKKYEIQTPVPKQFMKIGKRYNRLSNVVPGGEGSCNMDGVIIISELESDMKIVPKHNDPR
jgi:hypothetical protein